MKGLLFVLSFLFCLMSTSSAQRDVFGNSIPRKKTQATTVAPNRLDEQGRKQGVWQKLYPNNNPAYRARFVDNELVDTLIRYYPSGKEMARIVFEKGSSRGEGCFYSEEGVVLARGLYLGMEKDSTWCFYNAKGDLVSKENFLHGKRQGKAYSFYRDGQIAVESNYQNNRLEGLERHFFPDGNIRLLVHWHEGLRHGPWESFYANQVSKVKGTYVQGQRDGLWQFFSSQGKLDYQLQFEHGKVLNRDVLDSIQGERFKRFEENKGRYKDPENYRDNPSELLRGF